MIFPDRMFSGSWIIDQRLRRLPAHVQLLIIYLRPLCDRNGRFEYNPALIHMALYASAQCGNISVRDVEAWLEILRSGGFIKSYTGADGRRVGEVANEYWRQKLSFGRDVFEAEQPQPELGLTAADPPPKKPRARAGRCEVKRCEVAGARGAPGQDHTHTDFSLEALRKRWPHLDIPAEIKAAQAHVAKTRGRNAAVDLKWFERHWLPGAGPKLPGTGGAGAGEIEMEPDGWRSWLNDECPGNVYAHGGLREGTPWENLDPTIRRFIAAGMKGAA